MGNSESKEQEKEHRTSPAVARHAKKKASAHSLSHAARLQTTPHATTPSLIRTTSATSHTTTALRADDTATATLTPASSHNHTLHAPRPLTPGDSTATVTPNDSAISQLLGSVGIMGSDQSKHAAPKPITKLPITGASTPHSDHSAAVSQAKSHAQSPSARPVDVPQSSSQHRNEHARSYPIRSPGIASPPYGLPPSNYSRPPRLPLPIEEEVHAPGSPIISPQDLSSPIGSGEAEGLPRRASVLSSTTADDDEAADNEAYFAGSSSSAPAVPTRIDWNGPGEKVFVTGTFVNWDRKFKLQRSKEKSGLFSAVLQLKPGTHHIKFLVDNDMLTSNDMPTTVDYTNILVNYIEVVAPLPGDSTQPVTSAAVPGTAASLGQSAGTADSVGKPLDIRPAPATGSPRSTTDTASKPVSIPSTVSPSTKSQVPSSPATAATPQTGVPLPKKVLPPATYTTVIPQFLLDLDAYPDPTSERFARCQRVVGTLPVPPTLPLFLGKSILNGTTPHKDDASVLIMPNHTVLNHLATSSIKGGVLATSGTTRYKRKFLTTIMYRPTTNDG